MIKYNNQVLTLRSPARIEFNSNWNNDMATYYPFIVAYYYDATTASINTERFDLPENADKTLVESHIDNSQAYDLEQHYKRVEQGIEDKIVRKGKVIEVVKGRKVPVGTIGVCFWVGSTPYGESVGIETDNGRVFTSRSNVVVYK